MPDVVDDYLLLIGAIICNNFYLHMYVYTLDPLFNGTPINRFLI